MTWLTFAIGMQANPADYGVMTTNGLLLDGRYALGRLLGQGGFAEVFVAEDVKAHEPVAVKLYRDAHVGSERIASRLGGHPHIVRRRDEGTHEGRPFVVFDYVQGPTLRQQLEQSKQLSPAAVSRLAAEIGSALDYAHRHGVLHNDLKPENIILSEDGAQLLDFGSAQALDSTVTIDAARQLAGTVRYMAPEVLQGSEPTVRSDVYSFGVVLFESLTGRLPTPSLSGPPMTELEALLPSGSSSIFAQALSEIPEMRPQSAGLLAAALQPGAPTTVINQSAVPAVAGPPRSAGSRRIGRRLSFGFAAVAILAGVVAVGAAASQSRGGDGTAATETAAPSPLASASVGLAAAVDTPTTAPAAVPTKANNTDKAQPDGKAKGKGKGNGKR
jgi:serine/threonine-protein kinase